VSDHDLELSERRHRLQLKCAAQRAAYDEISSDLQYRLRHVDRGLEVARRLTSTPLLLAVGLGLLAFVGPTRFVRWASRGLLVVSAVRRLTHWTA
jgi:hypothetical protein